MKVCFFNTTLAWGGGERWHYDMAKSLHAKKHNVTVISHPKGSLQAAIENETFSRYSIKLHNLSFLNPFKLIKLFFLLKKINPDIIILNLPRDAKAAGFAAKIAGVRKIIYRRGSAIPIKNKFINRFIFRYVITEIIANSEETKKTILKNNPQLFDQDKIYVIYNGIDIQPFDNLTQKENQKEFIIGNLGRLVEQKGQKYLIQLAEILKKKDIDFKIIIGGDGDLKEKLKAMAKEKQVEKYIDFYGFVEDIPQFMNRLDVFVLPSLWEGFGYVLAEAMATKLPVLAFNVSSNPELITNGQNGFLVEYQNVTVMAEKILLLQNDSGLRKAMGEKGRRIVEEIFTREKTVANLEELLNELCPGC